MFVGHYSAAFAAAAHPKAPRLGTLFVAAQLMDLGFFTFVLTGTEHMRLTPGMTAMNNMDLYDMPLTHSLVGAGGLALVFGFAVGRWLRNAMAGVQIGSGHNASGATNSLSVINYADATYCQVDGYYAMSAALDFPSIAAGTSADLTIAAPGGVTLTAGRCVILGLPSNVPAGVVYNAFVTSGGASVTVRASNITAGSIDPASGTFNVRVMA